MAENQFTCVKGDAVTFCIDVQDDDGNPIDLTPYTTMQFALKFSTQDLDQGAIFIGTLLAGDITILDPIEDGVVNVLVPAVATAQMNTYRPYYWSLRITDELNRPFTPQTGTLIVTFDPQ